MRTCHAFFAAALLLCGTTTVYADNYKHEESGLQFTLPKGWTCTNNDDRLTIVSKDKKLSIVGGVIEKAAAKAIFDDIDGFLAKLEDFDEVEVADGPKKEKVNGLMQSWYEGTATIKMDDGESLEIEWDMTIITGGKNVLFLVGTGELDKNEETYEGLFESIEKIEDEKDEE